VLVTTPPAQHLGLTLEALEAGKHVIVEKPAFLHSTDVDDVEAAAEEAGRRVLVAENYCYKPLTTTLTRLLEGGEIGELRSARVNALKLQPARDWRGSAELAGGGALFEGGVHWVHLLAALGPEITAVHGYRPGDDAEPERSMVVVVRYANGAVGTLHHSWDTPALLRGLSLSHLTGTRGTITFESNGLFVAVNGRRRRLLLPGLHDLRGYWGMFDDFLTALSTGAPARMTLAAARRDLSVIESAYRSVEPLAFREF
jgi:UDP-N-acetylglucosamine 3-dehydrogenase